MAQKYGICPVCQTKHEVRRLNNPDPDDLDTSGEAGRYVLGSHDGPSGSYCEGSGQIPQALTQQEKD